jgi:hypothetical protein
MAWTILGSNPGGKGVRFSENVQNNPGAHPAFYIMGN